MCCLPTTKWKTNGPCRHLVQLLFILWCNVIYLPLGGAPFMTVSHWRAALLWHDSGTTSRLEAIKVLCFFHFSFLQSNRKKTGVMNRQESWTGRKVDCRQTNPNQLASSEVTASLRLVRAAWTMCVSATVVKKITVLRENVRKKSKSRLGGANARAAGDKSKFWLLLVQWFVSLLMFTCVNH